VYAGSVVVVIIIISWDFFDLMASAQMEPLRYFGPEANRWHGMSLSPTLMQTPTSIALQSLPELQPIMEQQPSQPNMPVLRLHTFSYRSSVTLWVRGMIRPLC